MKQTIYVTREAFGERVFRFCFGAYGATVVYATGQGWEDSFQAAVDRLIEEELYGIFEEIDYQEAASELGYGLVEELGGDEVEEVMQHAETDMTVIGHTHVDGMGQLAIPSWEWSGSEVFDDERDNVLAPYLVGIGFAGYLYDSSERFEDLEDARDHVAALIVEERELGHTARIVAKGEAWNVTRPGLSGLQICLENLLPGVRS